MVRRTPAEKEFYTGSQESRQMPLLVGLQSLATDVIRDARERVSHL